MKYCPKLLLSLLVLSFLFSACAWSGRSVIHPDYDTAPRPGFIPQELMMLDQQKWEFAIGEDPGRVPKKVRQGLYPYLINFGYAPESDLSGVNYEALRPAGSKDIIWYRTSVTLPTDWKGALLTLEGVDYEAELFVNGLYAGSHLGAYAPFEVDLTSWLVHGVKVDKGTKHVIELRVKDDRLSRTQAVGKQERKPYEGVIFYGNSSGAWKGAYLRKIDPAHYLSSFTHSANSNGRLTYQLIIDGKVTGPFKIKVEVKDRSQQKILATSSVALFPQTKSVRGEIQVSNPKTWTHESPVLYDLEVSLYYQDKVVEVMKSYAGFSDFAQRNGHFFLNNTPYYLRGVLNQMVFPKGLYTPDSPTDNAQDLMLIKAHGFNFQRVHQTTPRWRDIYDMEKIGVAWTLEMPSARDLRNPAAFAEFQRQWKEIIRAYGHGHPGLLYFVPMNEDWGFLEDNDHWSPATDSEREKAQLAMVEATIEAAPAGALVSPGDGWRQITGIKNGVKLPGINPQQLILSAHDYRGSKEDLLQAYGNFPVNAPVGTVLPRNGKELILSGFDFPGKAVAPVMGELGGKSYAPPGLGNVFGYGQIYRDIKLWAQDALSQMSSASEIKIFRGGYVYTQVRDAGFKPHRPLPVDRPAGELNGFLFADGKPKTDPERFKQINFLNQKAHDANRALYETLEGPLANP